MGPPRLLRYYIGGLSKFITILHGGGGLPNLLQYYNGGGSLGTPNLYYVIYGRRLIRHIRLRYLQSNGAVRFAQRVCRYASVNPYVRLLWMKFRLFKFAKNEKTKWMQKLTWKSLICSCILVLYSFVFSSSTVYFPLEIVLSSGLWFYSFGKIVGFKKNTLFIIKSSIPQILNVWYNP